MFTLLLALCLKQGQLKPFTHIPHTTFFVLEEFRGHGCVQIIQTTTGSAFQTKPSKRFKGHDIYGVVTVYRAVTVYRT